MALIKCLEAKKVIFLPFLTFLRHLSLTLTNVPSLQLTTTITKETITLPTTHARGTLSLFRI